MVLNKLLFVFLAFQLEATSLCNSFEFWFWFIVADSLSSNCQPEAQYSCNKIFICLTRLQLWITKTMFVNSDVSHKDNVLFSFTPLFIFSLTDLHEVARRKKLRQKL